MSESKPNTNPSTVPASPTLIRSDEVCRATGLSRSSLYRLIADGRFPRPVRLTATAVAWPSDEVSAWIVSKIAQRDAAQQAGGAK